MVCPKFRFSTFGPRPYLVYRADGGAAGALAAHIENVIGRGRQDALRSVREHLGRRFGDVAVQAGNSAHVGLELAQADRFSVQLTQGKFAGALNPMPTAPCLRAPRQLPMSMQGIRVRQFNL